MLRFLFQIPGIRAIARPVLRPLLRFAVGFLAIPLFRIFLKRVVRLQELDQELEKDLEQWFQGSLILLAATANMEDALFGWVYPNPEETGAFGWLIMGLRIMLAIGVIDHMPDQELFAVIHPGPPKLKFSRQYGYLREIRENFGRICKGYLCKHLNQSSPVFAILAAIATGWVGWFCYGMAIIQYLIIGLVTSRDKALDVLSEFDRQVALRRREIIEEFELPGDQPAPDATETPEATSDRPGAPRPENAPGVVAIRSAESYESGKE